MRIDPHLAAMGIEAPYRSAPRLEKKLKHVRNRPPRRAKGNRSNGKQHTTRHRP